MLSTAGAFSLYLLAVVLVPELVCAYEHRRLGGSNRRTAWIELGCTSTRVPLPDDAFIAAGDTSFRLDEVGLTEPINKGGGRRAESRKMATSWNFVEDPICLDQPIGSTMRIERGEFICSPSGRFGFGLSMHGDLSLWDGSCRVWTAHYNDPNDGAIGTSARMHPTGNLVVRSSSGESLWGSMTSSDINTSSSLSLGNDGVVMIVNADGKKVWSISAHSELSDSTGRLETDLANADQPNLLLTEALFVRQHVPSWSTQSSISVVGTTFDGATYYRDATVEIPLGLREGDMMMIFVSGSDGVDKMWKGEDRLSGQWKKIVAAGSTDINVMVFYRMHKNGDSKSYTVASKGVKHTWVSLTALRGVHPSSPFIDTSTLKTYSSKSCKNGEAMAPSVKSSEGGAAIAAFTYDDPHEGTILQEGFYLLSSFNSGDDGMTLGISSTLDGETGKINAIGKKRVSGGGQALGTTISLRAATIPPSQVPSNYDPTECPILPSPENSTVTPTFTQSLSPSISPTNEPKLAPTFSPEHTLSPSDPPTLIPTTPAPSTMSPSKADE